MSCIEISLLGSACNKNPYEPLDKTILTLLCRKYKYIYKQLFVEKEIVTIDHDVKSYDKKIKAIYNEYKKNIKHHDNTYVKENVVKRLKEEHKDLTQHDITYANEFLDDVVKKDYGVNNERNIINKKQYTKGNSTMHVYNSEKWQIRGLHDATKDDVVIEIKSRTRRVNVKKNEYDLYQLFGYLLAMDKKKGKIVQYFDNEIFDSDIETEQEYGIIDLNCDIWKNKFEIFKKELDNFFNIFHKHDSENLFDVENFFRNEKLPLAIIGEYDIAYNINPKYEKIIKTLFYT